MLTFGIGLFAVSMYLTAGELLEDPPLGRVVGELGVFASEPLVQCDDAFELYDIGAVATAFWRSYARRSIAAEGSRRPAHCRYCAGYGAMPRRVRKWRS